MKIPDHILAQANPLARATMQHMTDGAPYPAMASARAKTPAPVVAEPPKAPEDAGAGMRAALGAAMLKRFGVQEMASEA